MNTQQQIRWMIDFGQIIPPKHWEKTKKDEKGYLPVKRRPSRGGESFDWGPINRGIKRLHKVIRIILTSSKGNMTSARAYQIVSGRRMNLMPPNVAGGFMGEARFNHHYHTIRKEMGIFDGRQFKTHFIKTNMGKISAGEMAIYLETTENYVKQTIRKIKRGVIN